MISECHVVIRLVESPTYLCLPQYYRLPPRLVPAPCLKSSILAPLVCMWSTGVINRSFCKQHKFTAMYWIRVTPTLYRRQRVFCRTHVIQSVQHERWCMVRTFSQFGRQSVSEGSKRVLHFWKQLCIVLQKSNEWVAYSMRMWTECITWDKQKLYIVSNKKKNNANSGLAPLVRKYRRSWQSCMCCKKFVTTMLLGGWNKCKPIYVCRRWQWRKMNLVISPLKHSFLQTIVHWLSARTIPLSFAK